MKFDPLVKCLTEMIEGRLFIMGVKDGCYLGGVCGVADVWLLGTPAGCLLCAVLISQNGSSLGDVIN